MEIIYGINAVGEALKAGERSFEYVGFSRDRHDARLQKLIDHCRKHSIPTRFMAKHDVDRLAKTTGHQGVVAVVALKSYLTLPELLVERRGQHRLLLVLDGVEDPHNLGALIRTADAAAVDGVIIPERRSATVTATVVKASAGASEYMPIAKVTNINRTVEELKAGNVWIVGLDERGSQSYDAIDYKMDCALVLGAEGTGLHKQVREKCDFLVSIPMLGKVSSLNVSVAGAIVMYEILRQRHTKTSA